MDNLGNIPHGEIVFAIVAAAAISCLVSWLLDGGLMALRQLWLTRRRRQAKLRIVPPREERPRDFGEEFVRALALAVEMAIDSTWDEEAIVDSIVTHLGWSPTRARWFLAVNRDQVQQAAQQMCRRAADERPSASA